jgi:transcriptional regulator with XRE-family HTH domain
MSMIGARIRQLREQRGLSQGDIEQSAGLLRCYISRVENGHTVPSLETLERFAAALDVPVYRFFYTGEEPPPTPNLAPRRTPEDPAGENDQAESEARFFLTLKDLMARTEEADREVLLAVAKRLVAR